MSSTHGIIAYGTKKDREKLGELARLHGLSASQWVIRQIRLVYDLEIGADPICVTRLEPEVYLGTEEQPAAGE